MWPLKRQWRRLGQRQKGRIHTVKTKAIGYWLATLLLVLALRQQLAVLKRKHPRPRMGAVDRIFWVFARHFWGAWKQSLVLVNPDTVVGWHRAGFRLYCLRGPTARETS